MTLLRRNIQFLCAGLLALLGLSLLLHTAQGQATAAKNTPAPSPLALRMQNAGAAVPEKRVLALYYPWYRTLQYSRKWAHQEGVEIANKRMTSHAHYPAQGPYDSSDPALIDRHLNQAEDAGIDTLVCSWWGPSDPTDRALRLLLLRAAKRNIKICVLWEQAGSAFLPQSPQRDLTYLLETFGKQPAYLRVNDKPVIFAFDRVCRFLPPHAWAETLNDLNKRFPPGVLLLGDGQTQTDLLLWDGLYNMGTTLAMSGQAPPTCADLLHRSLETSLLLAKRLNRITIVGIAPGYDDRKPNATSGIATRAFVDRQGGRLYAALWQQAIMENPDWILINSFNQWHVGTEIEPSVEFGDTYLQQTRQYARQFKRASTP